MARSNFYFYPPSLNPDPEPMRSMTGIQVREGFYEGSDARMHLSPNHPIQVMKGNLDMNLNFPARPDTRVPWKNMRKEP